MAMFFHLILQTRSWNPAAATISMGVLIRKSGDSAINLMSNTMRLIGENLQPVTTFGSWITYIKNPPYNLKSFEHWRFSKDPIGEIPTKTHIDKDNLLSVTTDTLDRLTTGKLKDSWTYNFALKSWFGLNMEAFAPLHVSEYFNASQGFPEGDDSGKKFLISYKGKTWTLHDFWETGCGIYDYTYPFTAESLKAIDQASTDIYHDYPASKFRDNDKNYTELIKESHDFAYENIYLSGNLQPNQVLSDDYVEKCQIYAKKQLARAAYIGADRIRNIPSSAEMKRFPLKKAYPSTFPLALAIFLFIFPITVYTIWRYFDVRFKGT